MNTEQFIRKAQAQALVTLPGLLILVFILHFRRLSDFLTFRSQYTPRNPEDVVRGFISMHNGWPLVHDPHMIAYLALPLFPVCGFAVYAVGRQVRPWASMIGLATTVTGSIYIGGLFGMWTAFYRGLGLVDPQYTEGAIATFTAMTAPQGAFEFTTLMAHLAIIGLGLQALALLGTRTVPVWSPIAVAAGSALFLAFWDLDNWMLIGAVLMLAGFWPIRAKLISQNTAAGADSV